MAQTSQGGTMLHLRKLFLKPSTWRKKDISMSVWCSVAFIGLGTSITMYGPTLLDFANQLSASVTIMAAMATVHSVGTAVGDLLSGFSFDRFANHTLWMLLAILITDSILTCALPYSFHLAMLGVLLFLHGIDTGLLDNGVHAILMRIWKDNSGPTMQMLHFTFALGGFIAPLVAKPFISEETSGNISNYSCPEEGSALWYNVSQWCQEMLENCTDSLTLDMLIGSGDTTLNLSSCSQPEAGKSLFFGWAYWVAAIPLLIPAPAILYYAVREQCFGPSLCCKPRESLHLTTSDNDNVVEDNEEKVEEKEESEVKDTSRSANDKAKYPKSRLYIVLVLGLLSLFMFFYVGTEVGFGTYIFTYAVKSDLAFSKQKAAILSSLFWGMFTFFRLIAIPASFCVRSRTLMIWNQTGSLVALIIMSIWPANEYAVWTGTGLLGASMASIFPTTMTWLSEHAPSSGKTTGLLIFSSTMGSILIPLGVASSLDNIAPVYMMYSLLFALFLSATVIVAVFVLVWAWTSRKCPCGLRSTGNFQYKQLQTQLEDGTELTGVHTSGLDVDVDLTE